MAPHHAQPCIAILLSTFNGAAYLHAQLESLLAQSHTNWLLFWRDDGSTDGSVDIMRAFAGRLGEGRCLCVAQSGGHMGPTASFMALLGEAAMRADRLDAVAFADQDDVWLPEKLARGTAVLLGADPASPALYCARQVLVDAELRRIGLSGPPGRQPGFPASLTQNVATGCTVMLNRAALLLVARSTPSSASLHDWWCYLLVTAAGGRFVQDDEPVVLYRQHAHNFVGAPPSMLRRAVAALRRGPGVFMSVLRQNVAALAAQPELLSEPARAEVLMIHQALQRGPLARLAALRLPGLHRQTWTETLLFRLWFLVG
ncbi:MAG: hypothetical protein BGP12_08570 [Rhodospirillales bacterium 70-18]|nr:glycosyltransferase family 2 protein [Rhodospirillales bacterium]OJY73151.1 MAG: hypothetical protein BGP12_08570 [Rhodospirillales bacterium 70-18]